MPGKRPGRHDEAVIALCIEEVAELLLAWLQETDPSDDPDRIQECREHARKLLIGLCTDDDGYKLAKRLDDYLGYKPDSQLVDALEQIWSIRYKAYEKVVAEWVAREGIVIPEAYMGKTVKFRSGPNPGQGEITKFYPESARVLIFCPEKGHVREGVGSHGVVIDWENVEELPDLPKYPNELQLGDGR